MVLERDRIFPRPLTEQESAWIHEILQTRDEWRDADIGQTEVISRMPCDEGISVLLRAPAPENTKAGLDSGYIGRIVICTDDSSLIEARLDHLNGRLHELFVLFVDPKHPRRSLPERWTEASHEAFAL